MLSAILMTRREWNEYYAELVERKPLYKRYESEVQKLRKRAFRHFERDYTNCVAVAELQSNVCDLRVSCWQIFDGQHKRRHILRSLQMTCHVIFENGESLSDVEAIAGLGPDAPNLLKARIDYARAEKLRAIREFDRRLRVF